MTPDGVWRLSPAYDLTFSVDLSAPAYMNKHSLSVNAKTSDITRYDLEEVAQRNDIQDYKSLNDIVSSAIEKFRQYATELKVDEQLMSEIESDFVRVYIRMINVVVDNMYRPVNFKTELTVTSK